MVLFTKKFTDADYSTLTIEIKTKHWAPKFNVGDRVRIPKHKNIFSKGYTNIGYEKHLRLILWWKLILRGAELKIQTMKKY